MTTTELIFFVLLFALIIGAWPTWSYSRSWGYAPTGTLALILVFVIAWSLLGNKEVNNTGDTLRSELRETGDDIKDLGREVKDTVQDAVR